MYKSLQLLLFLTALIQITFAQTRKEKLEFHKFSPEKILHTIDDVTRELASAHPGFYRYTPKVSFAKFIDSVKATVTDSLTELEVFRKFKPIISRIGCLHTGITLSPKFEDYLNQQPNLFPFQLYFIENKAYVLNNYSSDKSIVSGDEIVGVNGQSMEVIIKKLLPRIPSDGYNLTMKYRALYYSFPVWYRNQIEVAGNFEILIQRGVLKTRHQIQAARFNELATKEGFLIEPVVPKQLAFRIENNTGFLTIHSFSNSAIKRGKQEFKPFIDQAFVELKQKNIQHLVVDLRDNTGGSDSYAAYFASYFFNKSFRYWDRIEVTQKIAKDVKGIYKLFYKAPVKKDSLWLWQKGKNAGEFDFYEAQAPAKNNFSGKTYILINGFCMSSCADFTAILSYNKRAVFIGQETGGGYQGNNSGIMPEVKVPPFNFVLTIPLLKYVNAVDATLNEGKGTIPDYPVIPTVDEIVRKQDREMQLAIELIANEGSK